MPLSSWTMRGEGAWGEKTEKPKFFDPFKSCGPTNNNFGKDHQGPLLCIFNTSALMIRANHNVEINFKTSR